MTSSTKPEVRNIATLAEEERAMVVTGNMQIKVGTSVVPR